MNKIIGFLLLHLICLNKICSQVSYIDVKQLARPNFSFNDWNTFNQKKNKLLVFPDNCSDTLFLHLKEQISNGWDRANIKMESDLTDSDLKRPLYLFGRINAYHRWDKLDSVIKQTKNGFLFDNREYNHRSDGFSYISPNHIIYISNSNEILQTLTSTSIYKYLLINDGLLSKNGYSDSVVINVDSIRNNNYNFDETKYFRLFVSKQMNINILNPDNIIYNICDDLDLKIPKEKITCYIHLNGDEFLFFGNSYYFTSGKDWNMGDDFGMSEAMAIHCVGNLNKLNHEIFHKTWELSVGKSTNMFFIEGIQEYYSYFKNDSLFTKSILVLKKYSDLDITKLVLVGNGNDFWSGPSEKNWPIAYNFSGCFTRYLIENWGLEKFKKVFLCDDKNEAFIMYYHKDTKVLIGEFYNWINNYGS